MFKAGQIYGTIFSGLSLAPAGGGGNTTRTQAFIDETGLSDQTIIDALNVFDQGLIDNSLDSLFVALYLFVGGTATFHQYNFMDAQDTDGAHRLVFFGGWTHGAGGAQPNGTTAYAQTHVAPLEDLTVNDCHLSIYTDSNINTGGGATTIGVGQGDGKQALALGLRRTNQTIWDALDTSAQTRLTIGSITDCTGLTVGVIRSATDREVYRQGVSLGTQTANNTQSLHAGDLIISAFNAQNDGVTGVGIVQQLDNKNIILASVGDGMTAAQQLTLDGLVETFETSLSRAA